MKRNESGFTLVEMMVTIAIGSLVTLAATTVLLLGLRINNRSTQTVTRQNTARVVITLLENLAAEGEITDIILEKQDDKVTKWELINAENHVLATYSEQAIYIGGTEKDEGEAPATPILEDVTSSTISLDSNGLLSISVTIDDIDYKSSVYSRTMRKPIEDSEKDQIDKPNEDKKPEDSSVHGIEGRTALLDVLKSQYQLAGGSSNPGLILDMDGRSIGTYYSEWYVGGYDEVNKPGWNADTPWCACFVSWGLCQETVKKYINEASWNIKPDEDKSIAGGVAYANVDYFESYFKSPTGDQKQRWVDAHNNESHTIPTPGDIIFIDWDGSTGGYDPAHVGVVLKVEGGYVYTIEGNRNNRVEGYQYAIDDPIIMGYGIIDWTE